VKIGLIATSSLSEKLVIGDAQYDLVPTRYGDVPVAVGNCNGDEVVLVRRAGLRHPLEPGRVNYRALILALRDRGVDCVLSSCVVGALDPRLPAGEVAGLAQFLDFTRHRPPTLFDEYGFGFTDMTEPYCPWLRSLAAQAAETETLPFHPDLCYVGVDGPRYETAAEVRMYQMLGGDVVGHTGVSEAVLAREAGLCHFCLALVSNPAAGLTDRVVSNTEVTDVRQRYGERLERLVIATISLLGGAQEHTCHCAEAAGSLQLPPWRAVAVPRPLRHEAGW
jgi:5'-methylthioadenosine phosphorylase